MASPSQVDLCNETLPDSKVTLCDKDKSFEGKIVLCPDECDDVQVMIISGPTAIVNGSRFSVTGGKKPIQWQITGGGTIDSRTGQVTDADGGCGTGQVIATDSCGNWVSKDVRYPSGQWVKDPTNRQDPYAASWCSYWNACTCARDWWDDDGVKWELIVNCGCQTGVNTCWTDSYDSRLKWPYGCEDEGGFVICCRAYRFDWECP